MGQSHSDDEGPIGGKGYYGRIAQAGQQYTVNMLRRVPPQQLRDNVEDYENDYADHLTDGESILRCFNV